MMKIWSCKIGMATDEQVPEGADLPMRDAIKAAYKNITGVEPDFVLSGWDASLTAGEKSVILK